MPKNRKRRTKQHTPPTSRRHPGYRQPCPDETLINEFGEAAAEWLTDEYGRQLTMADLNLEQAIRRGTISLEMPDGSVTTEPIEKTAAWMDTTSRVLIELALQDGDLDGDERREAEESLLVDFTPDDAPDVLRQVHESEGCFLNRRGLWDFGLAESRSAAH